MIYSFCQKYINWSLKIATCYIHITIWIDGQSNRYHLWYCLHLVDWLIRFTFYTPVFRRDVLWYGDVRPSGSPSVRHSFPNFSPTCFEILSWNFVYSFILMHVRSSLNVINFRQFLLELCPFWISNSYKYAVFRTSLLHALTYWAEILHMTLFYYTTDQVRVSSISVNFCKSYAPFGTENTGNTQFSALFTSILWHIELKFYTWLCFTVLQIKLECRQFASIFVEVMPLLGLRKLEIHIVSWNFSYDFVWCTIYQVRVSSLCVRLALHPSIHFLHFPPTCIDRFRAEI